MARKVGQATSRRSRRRAQPRSRQTSAVSPNQDEQQTLASSSVNNPPNFDVPWNLIPIDFGTATYSAAYYRLKRGESFNKSKIARVVLASKSNHDLTGPTIAAFHNGAWIIGRELELQLPNIPSCQIIRNFKIVLYDPEHKSPQAQKVKHQLEQVGQSEDQLMTAFFRYVWKDIWTYVTTKLYRGRSPPGIAETLVYITVPMLVKPGATERLRKVCREAELPPNVAFLSEPLCAAACVLEEGLHMQTLHIEHATSALVLDCGGGTTDAVVVKLLGCAEQNLHELMQVCGQPDGILRGSSSIDASFQEWLEQLWPIPGGFQRAADELGLEKEDIIQEATLKFQKYKEEFPHPPATGYNDIYICGVDATGKGVPLDRERIERFFRPHVTEIIAMAKRLVKKNRTVKYIFLTGGLAANVYFCECIERAFPHCEVVRPREGWRECPVTRGALLMEHFLDQRRIPSLYSLGLLFEVETFYPDIHDDAVRDESLIYQDYWYSDRNNTEEVVHDRIVWLLDQESGATQNGIFMSEKTSLQRFHIRKDMPHPHITYTIVFTRKTGAQLEDHEPLYESKDNIRPEFEVQEMKYYLSEDLIQELVHYGWVEELRPGRYERSGRLMPKCDHLEILCRFALRHDNRSIYVRLQICNPPYTPGKTIDEYADLGSFDEAQWITIWDIDTHVLKSSLSAPENQNRNAAPVAGPSARGNGQSRVTGYEGDDEMSRLLQNELRQTSATTDSSNSPSEQNRDSITASAAGKGKSAVGKKRGGATIGMPPSKRHNTGPTQMTGPAVNSRMAPGSYIGAYERPGWCD